MPHGHVVIGKLYELCPGSWLCPWKLAEVVMSKSYSPKNLQDIFICHAYAIIITFFLYKQYLLVRLYSEWVKDAQRKEPLLF